MPNRVSVKTEDLIGFIDSKVSSIHVKAMSLKKMWINAKEIKSFTDFRALESELTELDQAITKTNKFMRNREA